MDDYSSYCINIQHGLRAMHDALLRKDYAAAAEAAQHIQSAAQVIKHYCYLMNPTALPLQ